jgi:hypothetical protein
MTTQQSVETPIGFADGKVVRIEKLGMKVHVAVQAWDESTIEVEFDEVIGIRESMAFELSDLVVTHLKGEFTKWCTQRAYEGQSDGGESVYQFLDIEGQPCIEIVAKGVLIRNN